MGKSSKSQGPAEVPTFVPRHARPRPVLGLVFLVLSVLLLISIASYSPEQNPQLYQGPTEPHSTQNLVGKFGMYTGFLSRQLFGIIAWTLWIYCLWVSYMYFFSLGYLMRWPRYVTAITSIISLSVLCSMVEINFAQGGMIDQPTSPTAESVSPLPRNNWANFYPHGAGGWFGRKLYGDILHESIGMAGTLVVFGVLGAFSVGYMVYDNVARNLRLQTPQLGKSIIPWRRREEGEEPEEAPANGSGKSTGGEGRKGAANTARGMVRKGTPEEEAKAVPPAPKPILEEPEPPLDGMLPPAPEVPPGEEAPPETEPETPLPLPLEEAPARKGLKIIASEQVRKAAAPQPERRGDYVFPPLKLLRESPAMPLADPSEGHQAVAEAIVRTLGEFGVKVTMGEVHTGPVITRYDVYPAAGVRVEKIVNLDRNLALALKAMSVRILAPVPGRGCVGIEVPNRSAQAVYIRDILESEDWVNFKAEIPVALGKEVSGRPLLTDLTKMPHLLIAGSTGSGKTVCINTVVTSLLYHASPEEIRFVMVDPKIVEMQVYNALPHMLIPVVTEPKKVPGALKYLLNEMERRYQMFASIGVRNIAGYNAKMAERKDEEADRKARELDAALSPEERTVLSAIEVPRDASVELPRKLPYVVVIIDELADLMMVAPADIETGIARLAQLARAAGIHLIIATQRPSVNVITGVIKANLPSRIAFKVAAKVDSRTILDTMGADQLIGRGDLLFLPPGSSDLVRAQGAFVSDDEITAVVEFLKQNGEPLFDEVFQRSVELSAEEDEEGEGGEDEEEGPNGDAMVPQAIEVLRSTKRASTSMLQRRLRIGYNRAARIMEILEERGIVGPDNGSQPREILRDLETL